MDSALSKLEESINRLKKEYDLFLAGQSRVEPTALKAEVERQLVALSRQPYPSTAARFRAKTLGHRFRALESQVKNLMELRQERSRPRPARTEGAAPEVILDRDALEDSAAVREQVEALRRQLLRLAGDRAVPSAQILQSKLLESASRLLERSKARAVRFTIAESAEGPKIRGEILVEGAPLPKRPST